MWTYASDIACFLFLAVTLSACADYVDNSIDWSHADYVGVACSAPGANCHTNKNDHEEEVNRSRNRSRR